jgi:hydroxymethylbilane synthase
MNNILPPERLVMTSRETHLGMRHEKHIQQLLHGIEPHYKTSILGKTRSGDQLFDKSLSKIGSKGFFIEDLDAVLLGANANLTFHSLVGIPIEVPKRFAVSTILQIKEFH